MKLKLTVNQRQAYSTCAFILPLTFLALAFVPFSSRGAATSNAPDFKEVYDLLHANLAGVDEDALNRAAVQGLLSQLSPRAMLLGDQDAASSTNTEAAMRTAVFEGAYGYLRIGQVGLGADKQVSSAYEHLSSSNRLKGLVVDLRFADGQDYAAAARLADMFYAKEKPLLDFGKGMQNSTEKTNAFSLPLTILVNKQTSGAAEAFAGVLRHGDIGLLLGTNTAGKATMGKEFTLKNGQRLWIATALLKLGDGKTFPASGLQPDIRVEVSPADEQAYFEDAYKVLPKASRLANTPTNQTNLSVTNRLPRHRPSEADLVRMHRDGELPDLDAPPSKSRESDLPPRIIYDPVLARAIDLLKGLSVVQQFRSI